MELDWRAEFTKSEWSRATIHSDCWVSLPPPPHRDWENRVLLRIVVCRKSKVLSDAFCADVLPLLAPRGQDKVKC